MNLMTEPNAVCIVGPGYTGTEATGLGDPLDPNERGIAVVRLEEDCTLDELGEWWDSLELEGDPARTSGHLVGLDAVLVAAWRRKRFTPGARGAAVAEALAQATDDDDPPAAESIGGGTAIGTLAVTKGPGRNPDGTIADEDNPPDTE